MNKTRVLVCGVCLFLCALFVACGATASVGIGGNTRLVMNTRYDFVANVAGATASSNLWNWGNTTTTTTTAATTNNLWHKVGDYTLALATTDTNGQTLNASKAATVIGKPLFSYSEHACAIRPDNTVACWGKNDYGQLGDGTQTDSNKPVVVKNLENVVGLTGNDNQSCALVAGGTVKCWGAIDNQAPQPGNAQLEPTDMGLSDVVDIVSGSAYHCALKTDGTVWCWGWDYRPIFGGPASVSNHPAPQAVAGVSEAIVLASGNDHLCVIRQNQRQNRSVQCWGWNDYGQTGDTTVQGLLPVDTESPKTVSGINNPVALSLGAATSCAVLQDGSMQCWGDNTRGQHAIGTGLGLGGPTLRRFKPAPVVTPIANIAASAQGYPACALKTDRTVWCWGDAQPGVVGNHNTALETQETQLGNDNAFVSSGGYTCVLKTDGRVY